MRQFEIIEQFSVELFIELGMLEGGLAAILLPRMDYDRGFSYLGIEKNIASIDNRVVANIVRSHPRARIIGGDAFGRGVIKEVHLAIRAAGRAYVFCDNGDKLRELKSYSELLDSGDLISAHDYGTEVHAPDLVYLSDGFEEIEPEKFRGAGLPLFRKL